MAIKSNYDKGGISWNTERRKLGELKYTADNPRRLTDKQHNDLKKSLDKFNLAEIPVINQDKYILAGHMRVRILKEKYGDDYEIEVRSPSRKLTKKEADEYLIRSNKNNGEWDFDGLANNFEIEELVDWGFEDFELGLASDKILENDEKVNTEKKQKEIECPECKARFTL